MALKRADDCLRKISGWPVLRIVEGRSFGEALRLDSSSDRMKVSGDQSASVQALNELDQLSCVIENDLGGLGIQLSINQSDFFLS